MKATNIIWVVDNDEELETLPNEIEIPEDILSDGMYEDEISDYISDVTGFCHCGFDIEY